jgi:deoxyribodipyrimidine photo-lyase
MKCVFIFRRDIRLDDNTALLRAAETCEEILPIFIADPRQLEHNEYKSEYATTFMINSLFEINAELKKANSRLYVLYGIAEEVIKEFDRFDAVFINEDYTPFSLLRDKKIELNCKEKGMKFYKYEDYLLTEKERIKQFRNFSSFIRETNIKVREPKYDACFNFYNGKLRGEKDIDFLIRFKKVESPIFKGGRKEGLKLLRRALEVDFTRRDYPYEANSTSLSPHIKFGTLSIREAYYTMKSNDAFIRQLYWRDYYTLLAYYNPRVFFENYKEELKEIKWENDNLKFNAWKEGRTGFPIIDASMRQLNATGYINNRLRMLTSFFLVKVLFVDWRLGEKYFATKLVDYDPAINNGNWQWIASTGTDYIFRIYDVWKQQEKYDPEAKYIKEWVEELRDFPPSIIHKLYLHKIRDYPMIVDNWEERVKSVKVAYKRAMGKD